MNNLQTDERPLTWSKRANVPYYKARYALEIKHIFDEMILAAEDGDKEPRIIKYVDYPEVSHTTLYLKINQSLLYLLEKMDEAGIYSNFRQLVQISRVRSVGIKFSLVHALDNKPLSAFKISSANIPKEKPLERIREVISDTPKVLEAPNLNEDWKAALHAFVEKAEPGQTFKSNNLSLTMEDGEYIKQMIPDDKCIIYKASAESLFLLKLTPEQYAKAKE